MNLDQVVSIIFGWKSHNVVVALENIVGIVVTTRLPKTKTHGIPYLVRRSPISLQYSIAGCLLYWDLQDYRRWKMMARREWNLPSSIFHPSSIL
jgi:hypothetical protein